jgi:hypothetical protein
MVDLGARFRNNQFKNKIDNKIINGMLIKCSRGHVNTIEDSVEAIVEQERIKYNFGKSCKTHLYDKNAICNQVMPCEECIAYQDYKKENHWLSIL